MTESLGESDEVQLEIEEESEIIESALEKGFDKSLKIVDEIALSKG